MTAQCFDHERLRVYLLSIDRVSRSFGVSQSLEGLQQHVREQWLRVARSIPLNIPEGNGKRSLKERAAIQDVLVTTKGIKVQDDAAMKAMLTRMATKFAGVAESSTE